MGFLDFLSGQHRYIITDIMTNGLREGTILVWLRCKDDGCGHSMQTFHDLTETERVIFRNPQVENLLIEQGYLKKEKQILSETEKNSSIKIIGLREQYQKKLYSAYMERNRQNDLVDVGAIAKIYPNGLPE